MEFKKLLTILTLTVIILVSCVLGASLAWYSVSGGVNISTTSTATKNAVTVTYADSAWINTTSSVPVSDSNKGYKKNFTVTVPAGYESVITINLNELTVGNALKTSSTGGGNFKIALYEGSTQLATKSGTDLTGTSVTLATKTYTTTANATAHNYQIRIWVQDTNNYDSNQNALMGQAFSGKVNVTSMIRK